MDACLPLHRLGGHDTYLIAWDDDQPVGHAHIVWHGSRLGLPEVQDVYVLPDQRRRGVASALTLAAERMAAKRGQPRISLSFGIANDAARRLYQKLGYRDADVEPERVTGTIVIRGQPTEVDDTLIYLVKDVDSGSSRSS